MCNQPVSIIIRVESENGKSKRPYRVKQILHSIELKIHRRINEKDKVFLQLNYLQNWKNVFLCTPNSTIPVKQENEGKLSDEQKKVLKQVVKEIKERMKNYVFGENTKE